MNRNNTYKRFNHQSNDNNYWLSRKLSKILRHDALKFGLSIEKDGYVPVEEIINCKEIKKFNPSVEIIKQVYDS